MTDRRPGAACPDPPPYGGVHERVYRLLLLAYPRGFRRSHGRGLVELFRRGLWRARVSPAPGAVPWFWWRMLRDWLVTALAERRGRGYALHVGTDGRRNPSGDSDETETRTRRTGMKLEGLIHDVRHGIRGLVKTPGFTVSAVLILALGIGANVAMFSLVNAVLLKPQPFGDPDRIVDIYQDSDDGEPSSSSYPAYLDMKEFEVFDGVAAYSPGFGSVLWSGEDGSRPVTVEYATSTYMSVLDMRPFMGRWFTPGEDEVGGGEVAVVSYRTWQSDMGGDPAAVGSTIRLNGRPVTVVGVGPRGLTSTLPGAGIDFWLSISSTPVGGPFRVRNLDRRQDHWYGVKARLAEGVTVEQAQVAMDRLAVRLAEEFPELNRGRDITVFGPGEVRMHPDQDAALVPAAAALMAVVGLVLVVACANLANLLLVRGSTRSREMGIRLAMGGSRYRIVQLFLAESLTVAVVGGALGVWLAWAAVRAFPAVTRALPLPVDFTFGLDGTVLLFAAGLTLLTGAAFGLLPALHASRSEVLSVLREDGPRTAGGRRMGALRSGLVALQVAVSVVLLLGAGLFLRSLMEATRVDPGFPTEGLVWVRLDATQAGLSGVEARQMVERVEERFGALPGVEAVAVTSRLPASGRGSTTTVVEGYDPPSGTGSVELPFAVVGRGYFETLGQQVLAGREFTGADGPETPRVLVVNEELARRYWGGVDVLGRRVRPQGAPDAWYEVVGVVANTPVESVTEPATPQLFYSADQSSGAPTTLILRTRGEGGSLLGSARTALESLGYTRALRDLGTFQRHLDDALAGNRMSTGLLGGIAVLALLLASVGIYGVVSYTVTLRSREIGIRMALGADAYRVLISVLGRVMGVVAFGAVLGLAVGLSGAGRLEGLLFRTTAWDPAALLAVVGVLGLAALVATYRPARRAAAADPAATLRSE